MTTTVLNLKISQVENKIPNASGLVKKKKKKKKKKKDTDDKLSNIEGNIHYFWL